MLKTIVSVLILYVNQNIVLSTKPKQECGYKQCPPTRDGALNVHLIPHSHMDAGWVKTFDEYYYGTKTSVSTANVQLIYHTVMSELLHDKRRKFTFSEAAYFWRWWKEQRPATRATFRSLVQEGRIEFAGGGWVQNDEATLDYDLIIDQFTWGLRKINDTVGPCGKPRAAWQIDAYGHTREQASLLAQMGYDGLFIGRVDHRLREAMIDEDRMEFMWRGSDVLGKMSDIMTHTLYNLYNAPDGFCFDFLCSDEPIVDDPDSKVYNAEKRVNDFISQIERQAKYYEHDNLIVTMGGDFTYQGAANWFMNMDKLINHVNTHPANITDVNIFYSTPSCFLKAIYLYGRRNKAVYTEKGDHIPYGSDVNTYWTGYYSSRPALKLLVRKAASFLRVIKQLTVLARLGDSYELHLLRHAVNLVLHHDAITGTSQQHVANDFVRLLSEAIDACTKKISYLLSSLTPTWGWSRRSKTTQHFTVCHELNMTQCQFTESQEAMLLMVYNPSTVKTYHHVRIPGVALHYSIRDYNDEEVEYQLVPLPAAIINLPGRSSSAIQELCFEAENVPPLGFSAYYISPVRDQLEEMALAKKITKSNESPDTSAEPNIANEYLKVYVDKETGLMKMIQHIDGTKLEIAQNFHYYSPSQQGLQSGAYSFRPEKSRPTPVSDKATFTIVSGPIVKEIRQKFSDWVTQVIRLHRGEEFVELDWTVGPVPIGTDLGKEIVSLFQTNISHKGEFYTDSNGRHMIQRTCWNYTGPPKKKPVPACYFPVTSRICIHAHNASAALCVLPDRAQGGASYQDGEIELMVHRRLLTDDGFGLEESLNEEAYGVGLVVRGKHRLYISNHMQEQDGLSFNERMSAAARRWRYEPWLFFTPGEKINRRKWQSIRTKRFTALRLHGVPRHVHVLTLEPWKAGTVLLRLENTRTSQDHEAGGGHVTVRLRKLFLHMKVVAVRETTLAGNQWLDDARQMDWSTRYVYDGADDDILPEDQMEYRKDAHYEKEEEREDLPLSEEDPSYQKQKASKRLPPRERSRINFNRQKRSLNESIGQNIINATFNESNDADIKGKSYLNNSEFSHVNIKMPKFNNFNDTYSTYVPESGLKLAKSNLLRVKKKSPKLNFLSTKTPVWAKHAKMEDERLSDEVTSDEEDYAAIVRRNRKKKKDRKILASSFSGFTETDDVDDGVTKSIYEMYYKVKPRQASFKPRGSQERHDIPETTRNKNKKKTQDSGENMKNRRKKIKDTEDSAEIRKNSRKNIKNTEDSSDVEKNRKRMAKNPGDSAEILKNRKKMSKNTEHSAEIVAKRKKMSKNTEHSAEIMANNRKMAKNTEDSEEMLKNRRKIIKNTEDSGETLKNKRKMVKHAEGSAEVENKEYGERGSGEDMRKNNSKSKNKRRKPMSSDTVDMPFFLTGNFPAQKKTQPRPGMSDSGEDRTQGLGTQYGSETLRRELSDLRVNQRDRDDYDTPVEDEEEKELDRDYRQTVHRRNRSRQRRSPDELPTETASEQEADEAGEFVATLRPTQIRTFIVWLEPPKKPYI